jgi:hypothetical protein
MQFGIGKLAGTVNCNKEMKLAFFRPHFGNIDCDTVLKNGPVTAVLFAPEQCFQMDALDN